MKSNEFLLLVLVAVAAYWLGARSNSGRTGSAASINALTDSATGIEFPNEQAFYVSKPSLYLLGIGTRKKAIINVYSVGLFVSDKIKESLSKSGAKGTAVCDTIRDSSSPKAMQLTFAMAVGPEKIAEAISGIEGVDEAVKSGFHDMLIKGLGGGKLKKGESMSFEWKGAGTIVATGRGSYIGEMKDKALAFGILDLYLGPNSVSQSLLKNLGCA
mmetsp:Transcript_5037/g.7278  ORF Transcript_5037/g.7278 Transcript_5037/m.7278 type:complete len:215 (-) Transcript_5037:177-821(-)|eukprot:CAMPEP_0194213596 /NCGR_PEP_ID=MMETSP0156-20130528/14308_1 /TAXON_ID=33649 /ORGANISM="Thalassionema nitzschioides, Strain L26-B" /LENGTH=214 /DNA_ID=CAMNT_0038941665 /DNA_START=93 /DNA_END=737 /DNA_ORIENTATION=+